MNVTVIGIAKDEGSVVLFDGVGPDGEVRFAVDHRYAQRITAVLSLGERPEVNIESWQIL